MFFLEKLRQKKISVLDEFKAFALRGSMVDLAIGVILGAAFGRVVTSLVTDVVMPPLGILLGEIDLSSFQVHLKEASGSHPAVSIKYGAFISAILDFGIISFVIFAVIKGMIKLKMEKPFEKECSECLSLIPREARRCKFCTSSCP